ncbi:MAG TPA: hypothetical protein VNM87_13785, partial [Candidatus Udaeobacter sp.]|nr:hypothetical protein [Candidatus Udaeobacter sp.]
MLGPDTILWWLLKGSAILVIGWVATLLLRRQPAAVRHAVWTIAVIGQLLVPVANLVPMPMPELAVPMPSWAPAEPS